MKTLARLIFIKLTSLDIATLLLSFIFLIMICWHLYLWRHRRFYDMIRKFTGPSPLPIIGNLLTFCGDNTERFYKFAQLASENESPTLMWNSIFMPFVIVFDYENIQIVSNNSLQRDLLGFLNGFGEDGLLDTPVEKWRKLRRLHNQCFGPPHMARYLDVINAKTSILTDRLESFANSAKIVDMWEIIGIHNTEIISENMTGYNIKLLGLDPSKFAESELMVLKLTIARIFNKPWLYPDIMFKLYLLYTRQNHFFKRAVSYTRTILEAKIKDYVTESSKTTPISEGKECVPQRYLDSIFKVAREYPTLANNYNMHEDLWGILATGIDTTVTSMCFLLLMLAMHEDVQQRVYEEIVAVFEKDDRPVQMEDLTKLKYLEQCMKETLRKFTLIPIMSRRMTSDITLTNGLVLPKDTFVIMYYHLLHTNPQVYMHPDAWNPQHFADENADKYKTSFLPFGAGPRRCLGSKYVMVSVKTQIVHVLRKYRLTTNWTMDQIVLDLDLVTRSKNGYPIRFHYRNE